MEERLAATTESLKALLERMKEAASLLKSTDATLTRIARRQASGFWNCLCDQTPANKLQCICLCTGRFQGFGIVYMARLRLINRSVYVLINSD
jgi:hypothetical protein